MLVFSTGKGFLEEAEVRLNQELSRHSREAWNATLSAGNSCVKVPEQSMAMIAS